MIGNAVHIAKIATGEEAETTLSQPAKRKSGIDGAKARAESLSPEEPAKQQGSLETCDGNQMDDWFLFSGEIRPGRDLKFIESVAEHNETTKADRAKVVMCSRGGDPDAAYKMARYLQHRYDSHSVIVSGLCKSAATLFAIGADELIFTPFGELGPLDIQLPKEDKLFGQESGLNITEAILTLEGHARQTFNGMIVEVIGNSGGIISFRTASEVVTGMVSALYGPIFSQIEPEEVGSRIRAMRIGEQYAERLDRFENLKPWAIDALFRKYSD